MFCKRLNGKCRVILLILACLFLNNLCFSSEYVFTVKGNKIYLNNNEFKVIGLRCSNALASDASTRQLVDNLDVFKSYGINTISVYFMGSRFGDVKGYRPDASLDPVYAARMSKIIEAADKRGMVVLVGCLYWSTSKAKEDLGDWRQADANKAIANTVKWLSEHQYRNVFVDPDNEGMAVRDNDWKTEQMIKAAHAVAPSIMIANNSRQAAPSSDLNSHRGPKESDKPWLNSEAPPRVKTVRYWGDYSKSKDVYNYIRVGRYSAAMKEKQIEATRFTLEKYNGYMLASTWLQCVSNGSINGPYMKPGGYSVISDSDIDKDIEEVHEDAGIRWWLEFIKAEYGPWEPKGQDKECRN